MIPLTLIVEHTRRDVVSPLILDFCSKLSNYEWNLFHQSEFNKKKNIYLQEKLKIICFFYIFIATCLTIIQRPKFVLQTKLQKSADFSKNGKK